MFYRLILSHMENYNPALDSVFHALADPTRRAVIQRLGCGSASVSELAEPFDMALPSFMKHISVLESAGLIGSKKTGRVRTCKLDPEKLTAAEKWFGEQRSLWEGRFQNLDNLIMKLSGDSDDT